MENKKILFGLIGVGALAGLYFWNKNKKSGTNVVADTPKTDIISDGAKKIIAYVDEKYQKGLNPKYAHHDYKEFFSKFNNYGSVYLSLEQVVNKFSKSENDKNTIVEIYLYEISRQLDDNKAPLLSNEGSLFLAKNPEIIDEIRGVKTRKFNIGNLILDPSRLGTGDTFVSAGLTTKI